MDQHGKKESSVCKFLRSKNSFGMNEGGGAGWSGISDPNATIWCNLTMGPVGPDNKLVSPESCTNKRRCFRD